ncbi:hypothetical protein [Novipirellula caenicola]|uniref:Uncharacterized protein n=1 Tax=Novipirellula caenicola TaxID=1536901 RepID=A0ABP9VPT3_9BACT
MFTQQSFRVCLIMVGVLFTWAIDSEMSLRAEDLPSLSDVLPAASEDVDGIELVDDWMENTIVLVGTPDDDKITIEIDDDRIRFRVNGESVGSIRERDLPPDPFDEDVPSMSMGLGSALKIIVSGAGGNDWISLAKDYSDGPPLNTYDRLHFILYGDDGFDFLSSVGVDQVSFVGGLGIDTLIGDGFDSEYLGSEVLVTDLESLGMAILPDGAKDRIIPGHPESTAYRNYFLHITPVLYTSPTIKVLDKNPPLLPGVPAIDNREQADVLIPEPIVFDTILIERDEVINDIGCLVFDLNFREDGTMMFPTLVE